MSIRTPAPVRRVEGAGERVERTKTFETLARAGFVSRGVIYGVIGILAVKLAIGSGGKTTSQSGALKTIAHQPFGKVLLIIVAIGLAGYSLWRLTRALLGHGPEDSDSGFDRAAALGSGVAYALMCAIAVEILLGSGASSSGSPKRPAAGALGWPGGTWIVGFSGVVLLGVALFQGYRGVTQEFLKDSKTEEMSVAVRRWISRIGTVGHLARMVVFGLIGIFLIKAAIDYNPNKAVGIDGALAKLAHHPYGSYLLGIVAAGLIAFAAYSLSDARYRRI
ncbi:MAG TPA: DUF1206 domain-containing protein [Gaiellaceae bacterium]|nr:DUF1206 domain-containing protein [Gaiellaceae bacterium]